MKKLIVMLIALALVCVGCMKNDAVTPENEGENRAEAQETVGVEKVYPEEETTPYSANLGLNSTTESIETEGNGAIEEPPIPPTIAEETIGQETSEEPVNDRADDGAAVETNIEENPSPDPSPSPQEASGESNTPIPIEPAPSEESSAETPVEAPEAETEEKQDIPQPLPKPQAEPSPTPAPLSIEESETEQEEPAPTSEPRNEPTPSATPTEEPTTVEIETPIEEPEPVEIEIETSDEPTATIPPTEEPTTEETTPEEPTTYEPIFINPAHGGTNPFENPGDTEIDEHDSGEYVDDDDDKPGEGIHF